MVSVEMDSFDCNFIHFYSVVLLVDA